MAVQCLRMLRSRWYNTAAQQRRVHCLAFVCSLIMVPSFIMLLAGCVACTMRWRDARTTRRSMRGQYSAADINRGA